MNVVNLPQDLTVCLLHKGFGIVCTSLLWKCGLQPLSYIPFFFSNLKNQDWYLYCAFITYLLRNNKQSAFKLKPIAYKCAT